MIRIFKARALVARAMGVWGWLLTASIPVLLALAILSATGAFLTAKWVAADHRHRAASKALTAALGWADRACGLVGRTYVPDGKKKPKVETWGRDCLADLAEAVRFKAEAEQQAADALVAFNAEQAAKQESDLAAVRRNSTRQQKAEQRMEAANAAVQGDDVDAGWFGDLGRLAGLRGAIDIDAAGQGSGGDRAEGQPVT